MPSGAAEATGSYLASDYSVPSDGRSPAGGALNRLLAIVAASGGGTVQLVSGGTYLIDQTVTLPTNCELAIPTGTTLLARAGLAGDVIGANAASGIAISGRGTIDANRAGGGQNAGNGVTLTGCVEPRIEEVSIVNCWQDGIALVNCVRPVLDVLVGGNGRHGVYHSGTTFGLGQVTARDNGQRVAGSGVAFDVASTDNSYQLVATDTRVGGAKTQQYGIFEVPASGCDRNVISASSLTGNALGTLSLVGGASGYIAGAPAAATVGDAQIAAGGLSNAALGSSVQRLTQLVNGGFETSQRQPTGTLTLSANGQYTADRWQIALLGTATIGTYQRDTANADGGSGACGNYGNILSAAAGTANYIGVFQKAENYLELRGVQQTFRIRVKNSAAANVAPYWSDGITGGGTNQVGGVVNVGTVYTTITLTFTPAANATQVIVGVALSTVANAYLDNATLVPGAVAMDYVPPQIPDDLTREQRYLELMIDTATNAYILVGQETGATAAYFPWRFAVPKGGAPSITVTAPTAFGILNTTAAANVATTGLALNGSATTRAAALQATTAAGLVAGQAGLLTPTSATAQVAAEWNP